MLAVVVLLCVESTRLRHPKKNTLLLKGYLLGSGSRLRHPGKKKHPPDTEDYTYLSDGTKMERPQWAKDVMRRVYAAEALCLNPLPLLLSKKAILARLHEAEAARLYDVEQEEQSKKARQAKCHELKAAFKAKVKSELQ